jgi:hypothetical protein
LVSLNTGDTNSIDGSPEVSTDEITVWIAAAFEDTVGGPNVRRAWAVETARALRAFKTAQPLAGSAMTSDDVNPFPCSPRGKALSVAVVLALADVVRTAMFSKSNVRLFRSP